MTSGGPSRGDLDASWIESVVRRGADDPGPRGPRSDAAGRARESRARLPSGVASLTGRTHPLRALAEPSAPALIRRTCSRAHASFPVAGPPRQPSCSLPAWSLQRAPVTTRATRTEPTTRSVGRRTRPRPPTCTRSRAAATASWTSPTGAAVEVTDDGWSLGDDDGATPFFMQATALGRYLLYGTDGEMVAADGDEAVAVTTEPGPPADWVLSAGDDGFALTNLETELDLVVDDDQRLVQGDGDGDADARWSLDDATGCTEFPDISTGATGEPFVGEGVGRNRFEGFLDAHTHVTAFRSSAGSFHCGRPWSPYGVTVALVDCPDHTDGGPASSSRACSATARSTPPTRPTAGRPSRAGRSPARSPTRAPTGGGSSAPGAAGCGSWSTTWSTTGRCASSTRSTTAPSATTWTTSVHQAAGHGRPPGLHRRPVRRPGQGLLPASSTHPSEAREVINDGKLAVVLGVEVSEVFDCGLDDGEPALRRGPDRRRASTSSTSSGVRSVFPVHKFDNALGGTAYDGGINGLLVNAGNRYVTGEWWGTRDLRAGCRARQHRHQPGRARSASSSIRWSTCSATRSRRSSTGELPTYPPGPHCNPRGLTDLGELHDQRDDRPRA